MQVLNSVVLCIVFAIFANCFWAQLILKRQRRIHDATTVRTNLRDRVYSRFQRHKERTTTRVCYDIVGCFEVPHKNSPLQKTPEPPEDLDTKFYLFRRDITFASPEVLFYEDNGTSLANSKFDFTQPLKVYIHGYQSRWNDKAPFLLVDAFLKIENCNVLIMDWSKGAKGPQYAMAAANTEIAGRQLGILLQQMIERGLDPLRIHLIGFSLGAHVAGCASEYLKSQNLLLGRITALDAAGPLFRNNHLKEKSKKLDKTDAQLVDAIHTDSSPVFLDGFGLWEPIGHVDFFANGGQEQPGCFDQNPSIVVTTFDRTLTRETACSHLRAIQLFLESVMNKATGNKCQFLAFKCPGGLPSYKKAQCFPQIEDKNTNPLALDREFYTDIGKLGVDVAGDGVMFLVTKDKPDFCGVQIQINVLINGKTPKTSGILYVTLEHSNTTTNFQVNLDVSGSSGSLTSSALSSADYNSLPNNLKNLVAHFQYRNYEYTDQNNRTVSTGNVLFIDKIEVRDIFAHSWTFCKKTAQIYRNSITSLKLQRNAC